MRQPLVSTRHLTCCINSRQLLQSCLPAHAAVIDCTADSDFRYFQQASLLLLLLLPGAAFYRAESAQGRDLAVLAAGVYRQQHGRLRVLDLMSGSGMRGARYLTQVIEMLRILSQVFRILLAAGA
jgi:hypothetical protein